MAVCLLLWISGSGSPFENPDHGYTLLLTPQRLRRLKRDRERQTARWINFQKRVESVPDSPERGFELALYYAVTGDQQRGREAVEWAKQHPCVHRQVALVADWVSDLIPKDERQSVLHGSLCTGLYEDDELFLARDALFMAVAEGGATAHAYQDAWSRLRPTMETSALSHASELYALCEYLMTVRALDQVDLRQDDTSFFRLLPREFLLGLTPSEIEHPEWMAHVAALALVSVDPNLEGSQFLQGWAMEDRQMLRDGPGVAYELLWADPYLPGIAYRNLDPWVYDPAGRLFARTDWDADACWIANLPGKIRKENCPADAMERTMNFGTLTLTPVTERCVDLPARGNHESLILWRMKPGQTLSYHADEKKEFTEATDAAGMWPAPGNVNGKVCAGLKR